METVLGLVFAVELLSDSAHLTALEFADPDGAPALGGADHGAEHELEDGLFAEGVGDDLEPPALLDGKRPSNPPFTAEFACR